MSNIERREIPYEILLSKGSIKNAIALRSFGRSPSTAVSTVNDLWPVTGTLVHQIAASPIDIVSDDANDNPSGSGARALLVQGLDANFDQISELIALDGLTPVQTVNSYVRHFSSVIAQSGVYAQSTIASHAGNLSLSFSGTGDPAGLISNIMDFVAFGTAASHRTVPRGFEGFIRAININTDQQNPSTISLYARPRADIVAAPFSAGGATAVVESLEGTANFQLPIPFFADEFTDIWLAHEPASNNTTSSTSYVLELYRK